MRNMSLSAFLADFISTVRAPYPKHHPTLPNLHPLPITDLDFDLSLVIVDSDGLDCPGAIRGGAVGAEVVLVRPRDPLRLEPSPTGGVVGDGTVLNTLEQDVTLVICTGRDYHVYANRMQGKK